MSKIETSTVQGAIIACIGFMQELIANYLKDKPSSNKSLNRLDLTTFISDNQQVVNR